MGGEMCSPTQARSIARFSVVFLLVLRLQCGSAAHTRTCPPPCVCIGELLDCSRLKRGHLPDKIPEWTVQLDLSHNKLQVLDGTLFSKLQHLSEIKLNHNDLDAIPDLGPYASNITTLILANNRITRISVEQLRPFLTLETLDLSNNNIVEVKASSFPALPLKNLFLNNNRISSLETGCFTNLSSSLQVLRLNRNRISTIPAKLFQLPNLQHLELSRNRVRRVEGLTFHGLHALRSLKMQRNGLSRLMDGAFWGLGNMEVLQLDYNNLTEVSKGWLYGLLTLQQLHLGHNAISRIRPDAWEFCQKLSELDLSVNHLSRLEESSFVGLSVLDELHIGNNRVSFIADGAFRGLSNLQMLDLQNNEISWTIEDMNGPFSALDKLKKLFLQGNQIRSVTKKSFSGLDALQHLDLSNNAIMSIQANAFSQMKNLQELRLNTSSLLCDCQLKWLPVWVAEQTFLPCVNASCAHPQMLKGRSVFAVGQEEFVCDDFPKPQITVQPETQSALKGTNVTFICSAASSSDSPMTFAWKKDNEVLNDAEIHNQAHLRVQGGTGGETEVTEYTTTMELRNVEFSSEGKYQCVISNHFGSSYSTKARLTVNMLPSFTKMPMDLSIRAGATARLECAAVGHPSPQIAWQKDGVGMVSGAGSDGDGWTTVGIVIIAVVCCVVGTSLVWVVIIYHTRRRNEDCSVTNTDETNLPADIPSYLSSQGTLSDRQDGYIPSESGSSHQYMASSLSGFYLQPKDMNGFCQLDTGSETDMEAAIDPLLCHYQGPIGSLLRRENMYSADPSEVFTGCSIDQKPVCIDSYSGSLTNSKMRDYFLSEHFDLCSSSVLMQLPNASLHHGPPPQQSDRRPSAEEVEANDYGKPHECLSPSNNFMGTFGKAPWRPNKDFYPGFPPPLVTHNGITLHENPYAAPDADSDLEENILIKDSASDQNDSVYEQPFDSSRTDPFPQRRTST
ncbi:leucine-rich repeats and immunoglobulin-like domains protein 3 isoform X2 [Anarrhichthys ocellatus]|uniref:leucine-rich repeats and immunoglobulin-like domains protein 3 isoform X2 n=1 Tax=Anarrhichthys ocellatus TaxID=433405 RepID=UPI0012ED8842|nr:leucine-rich repeats and immunoglobulin-like domains protein 3 isoform X2 [Anarrhichthys ocellatus]